MTMAVVLLPADGDEAVLGPAAVRALRDLGVSHVCLLRDERTVAVVLEGWAFDAAGSASRALEIMGHAPSSAQILLPLAQTTLPAAPGPPTPTPSQDPTEQPLSLPG